MGNILKKLQEKRIDNLYDRKKKATMSGNIKKKERIDAKIAKVRGRTLSDEDYNMKSGGVVSKKMKSKTTKVKSKSRG